MTDTQKWQLLALTLVLGALLYLLSPVLTPFAIAALLAWLGDPVVDRLEARGVSRGLAVALVFVVMTLVIVLGLVALVPMLEHQISRLIDKIPEGVAWTNTIVLPWISRHAGFDLGALEVGALVDIAREHWEEAGGVATTALKHVTNSGLAIVGFLGVLALIPVVTFYFMRDWDDMMAAIQRLLPRSVAPTVVRLARESDAVLGGFIRGQLSVMLLLGVIYAVGLSFIGLDLAILIGVIAGLVSFVPYLGVAVGGAAAIIAAAVQFQDWLHPLLALGVFVIGQMLEGFVLTPKIVGDQVGLHPVAVIFAILAGGVLFGFLGVLLALPVAAVGMVVLRELHRRYVASELYVAGAETSKLVLPDGAVMVATDASALSQAAAARVGVTSNASVTVSAAEGAKSGKPPPA